MEIDNRPFWLKEFESYRELVIKRKNFNHDSININRKKNNQKAKLEEISKLIDEVFMLTEIK